MIKPKALKKGDRVGIVAPSGIFDRDAFEKGIKAIEKLGFVPVWEESVFEREVYTAGSDEKRAKGLIKMFSDKRIRAVFCVRGGYGAGRLLPLIDIDIISKNPKIFIGYSDITFLLNFFVQKCRLVSFHGPMVAGDLARGLSSYQEEVMTALLTSKKPLGEIEVNGLEVLQEGIGEGLLIGGCLSIVVCTMGTPYEINTKGKILFLEDTNEPVYRLDRMLMQLKAGGKFDSVRGIIFGNICKPQDETPFKKMVIDMLGQTKTPVLYRLPAGHGGRGLTLPFGVRVKIDGTKKKIEILEPAVS